MKQKFRVEQITPQYPEIWAMGEFFYWSKELNTILQHDTDDALFSAAYDSVDWEHYYTLLQDTPFYDWAIEGGGILTFGGSYHVEQGSFFSSFGDMSTFENDWLKKHPDFNQVLHDIHVETVGQIIDYLVRHAE